MAFNVLPSVLLLAALAMNNLATGGGRLFGKGLVAHMAGAGVVRLLLGVKFQPESSFMTVLLRVPFLLRCPLVLAVVMYRLSIEPIRRKDELVLEKRRADEAKLAKARALAEPASRDELTGLFSRRHVPRCRKRQQGSEAKRRRAGPRCAVANEIFRQAKVVPGLVLLRCRRILPGRVAAAC